MRGMDLILKRHRQFGARVLLLSTLVAFGIGGTQAASATPTDSVLPFVVQPIYPQNQQSGIKGYFELKATPDGEQSLRVQIINQNSTPIKVSLTPANALTMINGGIQYVDSSGNQSTHLLRPEFQLGDHITVPKLVVIPPKALVTVPIHVQFPASSEGSYLGGIIFSNYQPGKPISPQHSKEKVTFTINSAFSMAMAVQLDMPHPGVPNFSFGDVTFATVPSGSQLLIQMQNAGSAVLHGLKGTFRVVGDKGQTAVAGQFGPFTMAPQSEIQYPVIWANPLSPGQYKVILTADKPGRHLTQVRTFSIGVRQMVRYQNVTGHSALPFEIPRWFWGALGLLVVALVLLGYWLGVRGKRRLIAELERKSREERQLSGGLQESPREGSERTNED